MKNRILMVDDEPEFLELTKLRLEANGYVVATAEEGQSGLALAQEFKPDLIVLDINVAERIHATPELAKTPIVFLTALVDENEAAATQNSAQGEHFLSKVGGSERLLDYVKKTLSN
jgi:adenylate cyclase